MNEEGLVVVMSDLGTQAAHATCMCHGVALVCSVTPRKTEHDMGC